MTTNKISFISVMFVVGISFLALRMFENFNILDFLYQFILLVCFIKYTSIRKNRTQEE